MTPDRPPVTRPSAGRATLASVVAALLLAGLTVALLARRPDAVPLAGILAVAAMLVLRMLFRIVLTRRRGVPPPDPR